MDSQFDWEDNKKKKRFTSFHCQLCGKQNFSESIRCPECGRLTCRNCSTGFHDEEKNIDQMLCKICNFNKHLDIDEKRKRETIKITKILIVVIVSLFVLFVVFRWF